MNCCHLCAIVAKKEQIISCNYCSNEYCLKCTKLHLEELSVQKAFPEHNIEEIQQKVLIKRWLCFSCRKVCLCKACKGVGMANVERVLLGQKDKIMIKKSIDDYKEYYGDIGLFKSIEFQSLSPFEQEYFMNKVMLYGKPKNDTVISLKEISMKGLTENERSLKKPSEAIIIESDEDQENHEVSNPNYMNNNNSKENNAANQMIIEENNPENKEKDSGKMIIEE